MRISGIFQKSKGFTLIEALIVVAIIAILVAVALPSYQAHIAKGQRVAAQLALSEMAQLLERAYARQGAYTSADLSKYEKPDSHTFTEPTLTAHEFTLTATAKSTTGSCDTLSINQIGETTPIDCWK